MRIDPVAHPIPGPAPAGGEVAITVDGRPLTARAGEPIAMALLAHGIDRCRTTPKEGAPRGLFCGVGRCPDCAMIVDGALNVPTCITPVRAGMAIETQHGLGRWPMRSAECGVRNGDEGTGTELAQEPRDSALRTPHSAFVIVGGGPAGLAAALGAARAGVRATLIDEWPEPGGQLRHRLAPVGGGHDGPRGVELASRLAERARAAGVEILADTIAWGLFAGNQLGVLRRATAAGAGRSFLLHPARLVLATGATDAVTSFPGWTLPGVMLAGAVERAIVVHRVLPGRRFLVVGEGAAARRAADTIRAGGGEVVETAVPAAVRAARGDGRVAAVSVAPHGDTRAHELAVDSVCLARGRNPDFGLALQHGIDLTYDAARGGHLPARDARGLTSVPNLYVAGDAAGTREVADALLDGARVGLAAAGGDPDGAPALVADLLGTGG